jgi:hypothetical protein
VIDYGLLASVIVAFAAPALAVQRWPSRTFEPGMGPVEAMVVPAAAGVLVGRLTTLALDDPGSLGSLGDMLVIRSGVEFWPAVLAAALVAAWAGHRVGVGPMARLADLAPLALVGYGAYEAACVFRDGCYGPESSLGLRPDGLTSRMLPIGILMAVAIVGGAWVVERMRGVRRSELAIAVSVAVVAAVRSVGSIWLPRVGEALTRQHRTSILIAISALVVCAALSASRARALSRTSA